MFPLHLSNGLSWSDRVPCRMLSKDLTRAELLSNRKLKNSCNADPPLKAILLQSSLPLVWTQPLGVYFLVVNTKICTYKRKKGGKTDSLHLSSEYSWCLVHHQIRTLCTHLHRNNRTWAITQLSKLMKTRGSLMIAFSEILGCLVHPFGVFT